ncbi:MAG: hypothetical protein Q6364_12445 [Candidatus Hermodarchaeota archaeon]|nr:hypothetical protein [Candidatus Hermodarchaeota archaeon]
MMKAFITGYFYTGDILFRDHSIEIADFIIRHYTDSNSGLVSEVTQDLSVRDSIRNSGALANIASAFLDMYIFTGNYTYLNYGWDAINFVKQYHFDPDHLGFFKLCIASGTPVNTEKWSEFQYEIMMTLTRYEFGDYPPPTTTEPSLGFLLPLIIIGGTIIVVQVLILAILLIQRGQKSVKHPR